MNRLIDLYGVDINIRRRTETTDDEGDITYTYPTTINTRAQVSELTGYQQEWESPGIVLNADYLITFKRGTLVDTGDLLSWILEGSANTIQCVVDTKLYRKTGKYIDYIEVLAKRRI